MTKWRSFEDARKYVRALNLEGTNTQLVWLNYLKSGKKPDNIPSNPNRVYKNEWNGYEDWLRTNPNRNSKYSRLSYSQARKYARSLKIMNARDWEKFCKSGQLPKNIPVSPRVTYKKQWLGWADFLGTKKIIERNREYLSFEKARKYVHSLDLKSRKEWEELSKKKKLPSNIPFHPERIYKEFESMGDWLGTGNVSNVIISRQFLTFKEAKPLYQKLAKENSLKNKQDWMRFAITHKKLLKSLNISSSPWISYSREKEMKRSKILNPKK